MKGSILRASFVAALAALLAPNLLSMVNAEPPRPLDTIPENGSVFIDGETFQLIPGAARSDAIERIKALQARELGPAAIIFRQGAKLYIVNAPLPLGGAGSSAYVGADSQARVGPDSQARVGPDSQARPNRIRIEYVPPKNPEHQMLYETLKEHRVLETMQQILSPFRLPVDLTIKTLPCDGMINSWYNTDDGKPTVHMCYELLADILQNVPKETTPTGITPRDAVVGQFFFWTVHEVGHAMFDIFQTPIFGGEEFAADQFATFIMLQFGQDQARRLVGGAAYAINEVVKNFDVKSTVEKPLEKYSSVHGLPEQRFYNLLCLAYGADPKTFADVVDKGFLPKRRASNCDYEYQSFKRAFASQMLPHIDRQMAQAVLNTRWLPQTNSPQVHR